MTAFFLYNRRMIFSLCLLANTPFLFLFHQLVRNSSLSIQQANKLISLIMGCGLIGIVLSTSCFFMNMGLVDMKKRKTPIWWMVISAIAGLIYFGYIVFCIIERAHIVGIAF